MRTHSRWPRAAGFSVLLAVIVSGTLAVVLAHADPPAAPSPAPAEFRQVELTADDGVTLYADLYWNRRDHEGPLILLFHQAGSNARGEYGSIIPRLLENGYNVLALDQRSGDGYFGGTNRTVAALPEGVEYGYCDAYADLVAALDHAKSLRKKDGIFVWGSSYSAGLVFRLAAEHPEGLSGVLAFSPAAGHAMGECSPERFQDRVKVPVLALRPEAEMQREGVRAQMEEFEKLGFSTYVARHGVHGSSMLVSERTGVSTEEVWKRVLAFLGNPGGSDVLPSDGKAVSKTESPSPK